MVGWRGVVPSLCCCVKCGVCAFAYVCVMGPGIILLLASPPFLVGSKVMTAAAKTITNVELELGGKSPIVVFDDVRTAFVECGLTCLIIAPSSFPS